MHVSNLFIRRVVHLHEAPKTITSDWDIRDLKSFLEDFVKTNDY